MNPLLVWHNEPHLTTHINGTCNLSEYKHSLISQLRIGILPLHIETGLYSNMDVNERL